MPSPEQQEILDVQANYKALFQEIRSKYKAVTVSTFSQSIDPIKSFLKLTPETKGGICQALVNRWMVAHAAEGSLWNEIYTMVGTTPSLKIEKVRGLMAEFAEGLDNKTSKTSMGPYQKLNSEVFLMRHNLIPRMSLGTGHRIYEEGYNRPAGNIVADPLLGKKIVDALPACKAYGRGEGSYAMISIKGSSPSGSGFGHVMCAYLGGAGRDARAPYRDVAFFDPNYGEHWFDSGTKFADFLTWFIGGRCYKRYGGFQIRNFGVRARFAA